MAEFLSDAWIAELDRAARGAPDLAALGTPAPLVVEQRIRREGPDVVYHLVFDPTGARVEAGPGAGADLFLVTDEDTAWALETGAITPQAATGSGRLKIRGRVERLRAAGEALRGVHDAFAAVRDTTTAPRGHTGGAGGPQ